MSPSGYRSCHTTVWSYPVHEPLSTRKNYFGFSRREIWMAKCILFRCMNDIMNVWIWKDNIPEKRLMCLFTPLLVLECWKIQLDHFKSPDGFIFFVTNNITTSQKYIIMVVRKWLCLYVLHALPTDIIDVSSMIHDLADTKLKAAKSYYKHTWWLTILLGKFVHTHI